MAESDTRQPPAHVKGTRRAPDVMATQPHDRHRLTSFRSGSHRKAQNSLIEPWVDVRADLDAMNNGDGIYDPTTRRVWVNGRLYGMHENGTTFPIEGDGIIPVNRATYKALTIMRRYNGVNEPSRYEIARDTAIGLADRNEAVRIWELREKAHEQAPDHDV
ncbi:MAG: hypothetical protein H0V37_10400 [Chloroflexia bacterium]|nr:hypothetical protein [Chloroflexia bacterium]